MSLSLKAPAPMKSDNKFYFNKKSNIFIFVFFVGDANQLDLVGSLYVGSVDYMDPYLLLPPAVWSATLRYGFVGCLKDLYINGAPINVVAYAHEQDVGKLLSGTYPSTL